MMKTKMMKNKLLIISLVLVVILLSFGFYFLKFQIPHQQLYGYKKIEPLEQQEYKRQNITFLKMISSENGMYTLDENEVLRLKSLNINCIRICPLYFIKSDGNVKLVENEQYYINLIRKAHNAGFAVFLEPNPTVPGLAPLTESKYIDIFYDIASHWAEIAEEENVEFYSPLNEPNVIFSDEYLIEEWISRSQNLRPLFSGNLVLKLADIGPEKIKGIEEYDYLAFDIIWGDPNYKELRNHLDIAVTKGNNLKQKYNLKGFFFGELGAENSRVDEDAQAEIFRTILDETWGKVDGYCFLGWSDLEFSFKNRKGEEVIREWFSRTN